MGPFLERYGALADSLESVRPPFSGSTALVRRVALGLTAISGGADPDEVAKRHFKLARKFGRSAGLFSSLNGPARHLIAALAASADLRRSEFTQALEEIERRFRDVGLPRGGAASLMARALLVYEGALSGSGVVPNFERVRRVEGALREMRRRHRFLASREDLPLAVWLSRREVDPWEAVGRAEAAYALLRSHRLGPKRAVRGASHALVDSCQDDAEAEALAERLGALWCAGRTQGLRMVGADWLALVGLASRVEVSESGDALQEVRRVRDRLLDQRASLRRQLAFELAAGLVALERGVDGSRAVALAVWTATQALSANQANGAAMAGPTVVIASNG